MNKKAKTVSELLLISTLGLASVLPAYADGGLEEIIVTARRRAENLQEVPVSITAVTSQILRDNNIQSANDLQHIVPSMSLYGAIADTPFISIRGQGGYTPGSGPAVVGYLNEVPVPSGIQGEFTGGGYYDMENIQVLKGPQGTLFGRNTTGGAILFQTKRPTNDFGGYVEATAGDYKNREVQAALNVPLIEDKLLLRLAGDRVKRDGYTRVLSTATHPNGLDLDDRDNWSGRITLAFRPAAGVENDLIYETIDLKNNGTSGILSYVNQDPNFLAPGFGIADLFPTLPALLAQQRALGIRKQASIDTNSFNHVKLWGLTDILRLDITDEITFRNIFGYMSRSQSSGYEGDGTAEPVISSTTFSSAPILAHQYSEEPQILGKFLGGNLSWVAGAFLLAQPKPAFLDGNSVFFGGVYPSSYRTTEDSRAVYAQGTYDLTSVLQGLKATAGLRYTWDKRYTEFRDPVVLKLRRSFQAPTWTLGLDYQLKPDTLLYITSRRGYRSGGFNADSSLPSANQSFEPEYVTDIEVGAKSEWEIAGARARTNLALYRQKYTDIQLLSVGLNTLDIISTFTDNAAGARVWGAEFEGTLYPTENLEFGTRFSWLDFKYTDFSSGATREITVNGARQPNRPKYKYGVNVRYHLPIGPAIGDISLGVDWSWQDDMFIVTAPDPLDTQRAYGLLSANADWNGILGKPIDASFYVTNATDKVYAVGGYALSNLTGTSTLAYGEPRMFGVRLRYRFGGDDAH